MIKQNLSGVTLIDKKGVRVNPNIHLGESDGYISGDILDANAVQGTVNEAVQIAKEDIEDQITDLIGSAPEVLDTLAELADAIGDDPDFFNTINNELDQKVDKVSGKGLSTNDYTTEEKTKLAGIQAGAQVNPTNVSAFTNDAGYLTQHQDISGKEDKMIIEEAEASPSGVDVLPLMANVAHYYTFDDAVNSRKIILVDPQDRTHVQKIVFFMTIGDTPDVTFSSMMAPIYYQDGFELEAGKTYKVNALFDGSAWIVSTLTIILPPPPMNIITYTASAKLAETTSTWDSGLHTNAFSGKNGQLTMTSHTFENGVGTIEFNDDVTSISNYAFNGCTGLTSVTIPDSVTNIGLGSFYGCRNLTSVTIPDGVTSIGGSAFLSCSGLTSITIPNNVTSIGDGAFYGCSGLTSIIIGSGITNISSGIFYGCTGLTSITIPNNVTSIDNSAFSSCTGLASITIPDSVTRIGNGAFNACTGLTNITIGNSVTSIGNSAFYDCTSLTNITSLATTAPTIQNQTFNNVKTNGTLTVPSGSTGYDVWMGTGEYYLGKYNWTKVEQ